MFTIFLSGTGNVGMAKELTTTKSYNWWTKQKGYSDYEFSECTYTLSDTYKTLGNLPEGLL